MGSLGLPPGRAAVLIDMKKRGFGKPILFFYQIGTAPPNKGFCGRFFRFYRALSSHRNRLNFT
jgi:hypothetical protein